MTTSKGAGPIWLAVFSKTPTSLSENIQNGINKKSFQKYKRAAVSHRSTDGQTGMHEVHVRPCKARSQFSEMRLLAFVSVCLSAWRGGGLS
jgi:hypothetical protein